MTRMLRFLILLGSMILLLAPLVSAVETQVDPNAQSTDHGTPTVETGTTSTCDGCPSTFVDTTLVVSNNGSLIVNINEKMVTIDLGIDIWVKDFAWDPLNNYAIIVGEQGVILKMTVDGQVTNINSGTSEDLWLVSWQPVPTTTSGSDDTSPMTIYQGTYALIIGQNSTVLKWDGERIIHIMADPLSDIRSIEWSNNGDYATLKGLDGKTFRYPPEQNQVPFIVINAPMEGAVIFNTVRVNGMAMDPDGTIIKVEVKVDSAGWKLADGTSKWSILLGIEGMTNGPHTIYARAYDGIIYSSPVNIQVVIENDQAPSISIIYPITGSMVPDQTRITGTASDPEGQLDSVWVKIDNDIWYRAEGTESWNLAFDPALYTPGLHIVYAMAFDGVQYSETTFVTVLVGQPMNNPYTIILAPIDGRTYATTEDIDLKAIADDFGGQSVTFSWTSSIDGLLGTGDKLDKKLSVGQHSVTVTAISENLEASATVNIVVINTVDNPPTVVFLTPKDGNTVKGPITITGGADDDQKVMAIKVRVDTGAWRTIPGSKVWYYDWDTAAVQDGDHVVTAMAYDGRSWSKQATLRVIVDNGLGPKVTPLEPKVPIKQIGSPTTGSVDPKIASAVVVLSTLTTLAFLIGLVESFKIKFLSIFFVPLYSRIKKDEVLDNFTRGAIYGFIVANPGAHYNLIKQELMLNNGAIIYHLDILERKGYINSEKMGIFKKYYPKGFKKEGGILEMLTDLQRRIFHEIEANPGVSQKEIANRMNITARALNYHIKTLMKTQLIMLERVGRRTLCFINSTTAQSTGEEQDASGA
jgi:predicted transcriptional regulator